MRLIKPNRYRVAVELSGHWRNPIAVRTLSHLLRKHQVDWFIHTYSVLGHRTRDELTKESLDHANSIEAEVRGVLSALSISPVALVVEDVNEISPTVIKLANRLKPKNYYDSSLNVVSMWRKRYLCSLLRERFQLDNKVDYDFVIVSRPDLEWRTISGLLGKKSHTNLLIPREYSYGVASDVAAVSSPSVISAYSKVYLSLEDLYWKLSADINPHNILNLFISINFSLVHAKFFGVKIFREHGEPANPGLYKFNKLRWNFKRITGF